MEEKETMLRNLLLIMQDAGIPQNRLNYAKNRLLLELDNYDIAPRCTDIAVVETDSEKYIKLYLAMIRMEGKAAKTVNQYEYLLTRFLHEIDKPVAEMTSLDIRIWLARVQQSASLRTCETYRSYLSAFYKWLTREHAIQANPMAGIEHIKYEKTVKTAFSDVEIDRLRSACTDDSERAMLEVLLATGARISELCGMLLSDIDFSAKTILIREAKGGKQRLVYFSDVAREHLLRYLNARRDDSSQLFVNAWGKPLQPASASRTLHQL